MYVYAMCTTYEGHILQCDNKKIYLYCQMAIVIVHEYSSNPSPVEAYGQPSDGPGLVNIAGDCSEEVRKLESVTKTWAASQVADLRERQKYFYICGILQQFFKYFLLIMLNVSATARKNGSSEDDFLR